MPGAVLPSPSAETTPSVRAPPEVDQALRTRANAFLEFQRKGDFRKAYDLVAEDSKDYYFSASKEKSTSFTIDEVQFGADLSTAAVRLTVKREMLLAGHPVEMPQLLISYWKLEKGEWVWYHDPSKDVTATIIGDVPAAPVETTNESPLPKDLSQKAAIAAAGTIIAPRAAIDKKIVSFLVGKGATEQVTFHNSNPGPIRVQAEVRGVADTMTVEPNDVLVNPKADVSFKITYKPLSESSMRGAVLFTLEPFGSTYVLPVRILRQAPAPKTADPAAQ
ncbi:MAG: hypothetical protein ABI833_09990 [Acidobacteriota bacterium]